MKLIDQTTTIEQLMADPKSYGIPSFEEYSRNPGKWKVRTDRSMAALEQGPNIARRELQKVKYKINGVELGTIEAAERAILDYGYTLEDLELGKDGRKSKLKYEMNMIPQGGGKYDVEVNFLP